jgi:hypothetical protein
LAARFGLSRADSVPNLTRRVDARLRSSPEFADVDSPVGSSKNQEQSLTLRHEARERRTILKM